MKFPDDLRYTEHDEWIRVDGDVVTVGITDYAQDALGDLVHVELPAIGAAFGAGDMVCEVESVKTVAEIYTPVGGVIVEVNRDLEDAAERINSDPYGSWLFKLRVKGGTEVGSLLDVAAYRAKVGA